MQCMSSVEAYACSQCARAHFVPVLDIPNTHSLIY